MWGDFAINRILTRGTIERPVTVDVYLGSQAQQHGLNEASQQSLGGVIYVIQSSGKEQSATSAFQFKNEPIHGLLQPTTRDVE